jgi:hypothetical protein
MKLPMTAAYLAHVGACIACKTVDAKTETRLDKVFGLLEEGEVLDPRCDIGSELVKKARKEQSDARFEAIVAARVGEFLSEWAAARVLLDSGDIPAAVRATRSIIYRTKLPYSADALYVSSQLYRIIDASYLPFTEEV